MAANFLTTLGNIGNVMGGAENQYAAIMERKRQMELAELQRRAMVQQQQQRDMQMRQAQAAQAAGGQAYGAMGYQMPPQAPPGAQPMPPGMSPQPGQPPGPPQGAVPQQVPMPGARPMPGPPQAPPMPPMPPPRPGGPPAQPQPAAAAPGGAPQPGGAGRPTPAPQPPPVPPSAQPLLQPGTLGSADLPQMVSRINQYPGTKNLPNDQKALVLEAMVKMGAPEAKAQLELIKMQNQLEIQQAKLDAAAERLNMAELLEQTRQSGREKLQGERETATDERQGKRLAADATKLKARMDATAAEKDAGKPLAGLKADRTELEDEIKGLKEDLSPMSGFNQPQPNTKEFTQWQDLRQQLDDANKRLQDLDGQISKMTKGPAPGTPPVGIAAPQPDGGPAAAPQSKGPVEGQTYTDAQGNKATYKNGQWVEQP